MLDDSLLQDDAYGTCMNGLVACEDTSLRSNMFLRAILESGHSAAAMLERKLEAFFDANVIDDISTCNELCRVALVP